MFFIAVSLFSSISLGEEACCSIFEEAQVSLSSHHDSIVEAGQHFCEQESDSSTSHEEHFHFCVGCSHTPFIETGEVSLFDYFEERPITSLDYTFFVSSHYLDGPFQPPRA